MQGLRDFLGRVQPLRRLRAEHSYLRHCTHSVPQMQLL